ncbi:hypothetical protein U1Q18_018185 [Sarracenia purpurea var. burkii]
MENQSPLKTIMSRMFRTSFRSCKPRNHLSDVIEQPVFPHQNCHRHQLIDLFSPKSPHFPSVFRPSCAETPNPELPPDATDGRKCPPSSPISPLNTLHELEKAESKQKEKKKSRKKTNRTATQLRKIGSFESVDNYYDWFSSNDEGSSEDDDETNLSSLKSLSSDSSDSFRRNKGGRRPRRRTSRRRRREDERKESETSPKLPLQGKVKDSFAIAKRSTNPYHDFRTSMVEMIVEREIFGAGDLENLLQTFLWLNSSHHHKVIIEVYTEIWEALFTNCS